MPLNEENLREVKGRVFAMYMDTINTFELIEENAEFLFGENSDQMKSAINEYLDDFIRKNNISKEKHPEALIYEAPLKSFQTAGLYGVQLDVKERQVKNANQNVRNSLSQRIRSVFRRPFIKWIDIINNFLGSLVSAVGAGEALKELKDCMRDELPDEDVIK